MGFFAVLHAFRKLKSPNSELNCLNMDVTNSTLPVSAGKDTIDAAIVGRYVCYCLIGMMAMILTVLLLRKIAKLGRYLLLVLLESEENDTSRPQRRRHPRGIRVLLGLRRVLLGRPSSRRVATGVDIGEEALPDSSSESESELDPNALSAIRLPRYTSAMSLANTTPDRADSPPSYELATSPLPSYEEATSVEAAEPLSEGTQPPTYLEATMAEVSESSA